MEICDNCYDEVKTVSNVAGMAVCKSCKKDMDSASFGVLDDTSNMVGVMSDDQVVDYYRDNYANYND